MESMIRFPFVLYYPTKNLIIENDFDLIYLTQFFN